MRRATPLLLLALLAGCGARSPDLFLVERSGPDTAANLTMVVSDGGSVTYEPGGQLVWAHLRGERAALMLALAEEPVTAREQGVLFYLYSRDLSGLRERLLAAGIDAGEILDGSPGPEAEMRVVDRDGYVLMIAQSTD